MFVRKCCITVLLDFNQLLCDLFNNVDVQWLTAVPVKHSIAIQHVQR